MSTKTKKKFNNFYTCSPVSVEKYPPVMVIEEDGYIGTLVPEKPLQGNYEDYSIKNLIDSGIPLTQTPQMDYDLDDVASGLKKLSNLKNQQLNEN